MESKSIWFVRAGVIVAHEEDFNSNSVENIDIDIDYRDVVWLRALFP